MKYKTIEFIKRDFLIRYIQFNNTTICLQILIPVIKRKYIADVFTVYAHALFSRNDIVRGMSFVQKLENAFFLIKA